MSSKRFRQLVDAAYVNNDVSAAYDAYHDYQDTHCLHPIRQKVHNSHTDTDRTIIIPCGKCEHCRATKINEWCTRMYAHAEDFKNCYFVTLTYRSITDVEQPVNRLLLNKLTQAVWHRDNFNYNRHLSYNPCLLVNSHYQNFLKRLRKNTGLSDLTYVISGEYGSKYGRPHFHIIFFTNGTLTKQDIVRAWSVSLWKSNDNIWSYRRNQVHNGFAYDFPIGGVDFHDLVTNGTFNTTAKIKVDGRYMDAVNCFAYVCKYVCKQDKANLNRVRLAYRNLFIKQKFTKVFNNEIPFDKVYDYLLEHGYNPEYIRNLINTNFNTISYEKTIFRPSSNVYEHGLCCSRKSEIAGYQFFEEILKPYFFDFCHQFKPFCQFSRGTPIGSIYAKRHISEFTHGVFNKPLLQERGFVVPSYFRSKARNYLYGIRETRSTLSSKSLVLSSLPKLYRLYTRALRDGSFFPFAIPDTIDYQDIKTALQSDFKHLTDVYSGERIIFYNGYSQYYKYNRHTRSYEFTRAIPLSVWIRSQLILLDEEFKRNESAIQDSLLSHHYEDAALCMLTDMGLDTKTITAQYIADRELQIKHQQLLYVELHQSAE